jgi:hypothetical protein
MYVPSYAFIASALGVPKDFAEKNPNGLVSIHAQTLRYLLRFVAIAADFDEAVYLSKNPDVAAAYKTGQIASVRDHFLDSGFFEGRQAAAPNIDEAWYLKAYPDVADSIREGAISSAQNHFLSRGEAEMRCPDPESLPWVQAWAEAQSRARKGGA